MGRVILPPIPSGPKTEHRTDGHAQVYAKPTASWDPSFAQPLGGGRELGRGRRRHRRGSGLERRGFRTGEDASVIR
jgi:hypothetical protein